MLYVQGAQAGPHFEPLSLPAEGHHARTGGAESLCDLLLGLGDEDNHLLRQHFTPEIATSSYQNALGRGKTGEIRPYHGT